MHCFCEESFFGKNLIVPTLEKRVDKKESLDDLGEPPFFIRLPHKMMRKHNSNLVCKAIKHLLKQLHIHEIIEK